MNIGKRLAAAWGWLSPSDQLTMLTRIYVLLFAYAMKGILMWRRSRAVFVASVVTFILLFWVFADRLPGRVLLLAGVTWGAITIAELLITMLPWDNKPPEK